MHRPVQALQNSPAAYRIVRVTVRQQRSRTQSSPLERLSSIGTTGTRCDGDERMSTSTIWNDSAQEERLAPIAFRAAPHGETDAGPHSTHRAAGLAEPSRIG